MAVFCSTTTTIFILPNKMKIENKQNQKIQRQAARRAYAHQCWPLNLFNKTN